MDTDIDFLRADLLYQILIADRTLVIEPFTISAKLTPLKKLIEAFFVFKELDPQLLNDLELAALMFDGVETANLDSTTSKYIAFIAGGNEDILKIAAKSNNARAIILKKTPSDPKTYPSLVFYNKKTSELVNGTTINADGIAWCQNVIDLVKEGSLEHAIEYLIQIRKSIQKLFDLSSNFSLNHYVALMTAYSPRDQRIIRKICENIFLIDLSSIAPESLGQELMEEIPISPLEHHEDDLGDNEEYVSEAKQNEQELFQLAVDLPDEPDNEVETPRIENDPYIVEYRNFQTNSPEYIPVFEIAIDEMRNEYQMLAATPEVTYTLLRKKHWTKEIPGAFFYKIFRLFLIDLVNRVKPGNFTEVAKKEGQKIHDACEGLPGLPPVIGTLAEIQRLELDPLIATKLHKHDVAVLPVLPEKRIKNMNLSKISGISSQSSMIPIKSYSVSDNLFLERLKQNTKDMESIPKSRQIAFFTTKLNAIKKKMFQNTPM